MRVQLDGAGLRRELARRGMTQAELAKAAGVTEPTVSHAIAGKMVSYLTIRKLARALTVTPVLPGTDGIILEKKEAATESPLVAAGAGASANASAD